MTPSTSLGPGSLRPLLVANYDVVLGGGEVGLGMLVDGLLARGHRPTLAVPGPRTLFGRCPEQPIPQALHGVGAAWLPTTTSSTCTRCARDSPRRSRGRADPCSCMS